MEWRKAWDKNWDDVKYCSKACRTRRIRPVDTALEEAIVALLDTRAATATICPSEAARAVGGDERRELMQPARSAARRLHADGRVTILQQGRAVDPSRAKVPIRIGRSRR